MSEFNDLLMPKLGLTMAEGLLAEWCVNQGDTVKEGDVMFVVETDKVATDVTAQADGTIGDILVQEGDTVPVGAVVARWTGPGQGYSDQGDIPSEEAPVSAGTEEKASVPAGADIALEARPDVTSGRVVATPLARRLARQHGVDLATVAGSGTKGRIKAADVRAAATHPAQTTSAAAQAPTAVVSAERVPASSLVQAMARRMVEAKQEAPHFYLAAEAEVSELLQLRERLNAPEGARKLTINHFVIAAVTAALQAAPEQNRIWDKGELIQYHSIDVGIAINTERGLMAPVLHDLAGCSLDEIAHRASELVTRTREGRGSREDLQGGAITISNAGMFNVTYMTPIINPPQSAILGVGSIREVFRPNLDGAPELRREVGLVLAGDHRLHDGASGLRFLNHVIDLLQDPYRLLRGV